MYLQSSVHFKGSCNNTEADNQCKKKWQAGKHTIARLQMQHLHVHRYCHLSHGRGCLDISNDFFVVLS